MDEIQDEQHEQEPEEVKIEVKKTTRRKIRTPEEVEIINQTRRKNLQMGREKLKEIQNVGKSIVQETKSKPIPEPITEPIPIQKTKPIPVPVEEDEPLTEREVREYIRLKKIEDDKLKRAYLLKSQKEQEERFKRGYASLFGGY